MSKSSQNEEYQLIEKILNGNQDLYEVLVDRYSSMVFYVVRRFEKDPDEVEELAQEIFVKAYEKLHQFKENSKFSTWLYTIAMNHGRDYAEINEGIVYTLLLDFDALRSVHKTGQSPAIDYILKPVIRASNEALTGNIEGVVNPVEARAAVFAIAGEDTLSSTYADEESGYFMLVGLEEGSYNVSVNPREEGYEETIIEDVSVTVGESTDLETVELNESGS
ncbi:sigma-70 family RNA polymerase sigma factor [Rhodohalobacter halophilus]|uniref:sigma-70 family RNA polymerase sigma factor n=1 Tax=Rhodohalobacter halophilus TaxID=1812810 RepID=UPI00083F56C3|nr:sigma-70 family RNA polymerase sigma factor [Rhodohalobacter halophilus]